MESCTHGKVLAVALVGGFVMVATTQHEAVIVGIFASHTPLYLLHLLLEPIGGIMETLEDTCYGRHVVVFLLHAVGVVRLRFTVLGILLGEGGHEEFVGIHCHAELVVFVEGNGHVHTQTQVGGDKLRVVIASVGYLATYIIDVQTPAEAAFAVAHHEVAQAVEGDVGGKSLACLALGSIVVADIREDEAHVDSHREALAKHAAVACIHGELIRIDGHIVHIREEHLAQTEEAQRSTHR